MVILLATNLTDQQTQTRNTSVSKKTEQLNSICFLTFNFSIRPGKKYFLVTFKKITKTCCWQTTLLNGQARQKCFDFSWTFRKNSHMLIANKCVNVNLIAKSINKPEVSFSKCTFVYFKLLFSRVY